MTEILDEKFMYFDRILPMRHVALTGIVLLFTVGGLSAADVSLSASDSGNISSFNTGANWVGGQPPSATNDYFTGPLTLQTPSAASSANFLGNSLTVDTGGRLYYIGANNGSLTVSNLVLNGGTFQTSRAGGNDIPMSLYGHVSIASATTGTLSTADSGVRQTIHVYAPISGDGVLNLLYRRWIYFYGTNTYTGDTILSAYTPNECVATFESGSSHLLDINESGANSRFSGTGTLTLNGRLHLDVTEASGQGQWTIVETNNLFGLNYGAGFSITTSDGGNFQNDGGVWTIGQTWVYTEASGILQRFLPPGTVITLR